MPRKTEKKVSKSLEIIGWFGPLAFILGFIMVSFGMINARSYVFQLLNLTGAISIALISFARKAYQPAVLNVILAIIAVFIIVSLMTGAKL